MRRKIIEIDENKCDGCGLCIPNCPEGALEIVNGKVKLVKDIYCDGLGACLGHCPKGAIKIIQREAEEFDEEAVKQRMKMMGKESAPHRHEEPVHHLHNVGSGGCPGTKIMEFKKKGAKTGPASKTESELSQWPIQLMLVPVHAPYLKGAELLIAADCAPFSYADFHQDFLKGKKLVICCPKLDDAQYYIGKLTEIFKLNDIKSITVVHMEVPCCYGLVGLVKEAMSKSGKDIPLESIVIGIQGDRK